MNVLVKNTIRARNLLVKAEVMKGLRKLFVMSIMKEDTVKRLHIDDAELIYTFCSRKSRFYS